MAMMRDKLDILAAYAAKRLTLWQLSSRAQLQRRQARLLRALMRHAGKVFPFYQPFANLPFAQWPVIDKSVMLESFESMNVLGLSRERAWEAAEEALFRDNSSARVNGHTLGTSTGTSGQRGLFIISDHERRLWLGSILARCLPDFPFTRHRVALLLATGNGLYETSSESGRLQFAFFDLRKGLSCHSARLQAFAPDVLIGAPSALAELARLGVALPLRHVFTGGEVLDTLQARQITAGFDVAPRPIYQATEGFLGVACAHGSIHLNEDDLLIEEEPVAGQSGHFVPVITDLRRRAQAMIRYRLMDVLVKRDTPCPCGSCLLALSRVEGRMDDVVRLPAALGGRIAIMPEVLRATLLDADRSVRDFRLVQTGEVALVLSLPFDTSEATQQAVLTALQAALQRHGAKNDVSVSLHLGLPPLPPGHKLRRIQSSDFSKAGMTS